MDRFQLAKRTKKQGTVPQKQEGTEQRLKVSKEQGGVGACGGWGAHNACPAWERPWRRKPKYSNCSLLFMMQLPPTHKESYLVYGKVSYSAVGNRASKL